MNQIFRELLRKCVLVFFYDILVYSKSWELHLQHLHNVFEILRANHFYAKLSNVSLALLLFLIWGTLYLLKVFQLIQKKFLLFSNGLNLAQLNNLEVSLDLLVITESLLPILPLLRPLSFSCCERTPFFGLPKPQLPFKPSNSPS